MSDKPTSYDLIAQADTIATRLMNAEGDEAIDTILKEEQDWKGSVLIKLESHRHVRKALLTRATYFREQIERLRKRRDKIDDNIRRLDQRALALVSTYEESTGKDRAQLADGSWVRSNINESYRVIIKDPSKLDPFYCETRLQPDRALIRQTIEEGNHVEGAELQPNINRSIRWSK